MKRRVILGFLGAAAILYAQEKHPSFEVASVHRAGSSPDSKQGQIGYPPGRLSVTNVSLRMLIWWAYKLPPSQVAGGTGWVDSARWNIEAAEGSAFPLDEVRLMAQSLLAERFQLALHRETRQMQLYEMTTAKSGLKLAKTHCLPNDPNKPGPSCGYLTVSSHGIHAMGVSMEAFTRALSSILQTRVVDRTGFQGNFDEDADWRLDQSTTGSIAAAPQPPQDEFDSNAPSIFTALEEQLGLRLQSAKGTVEMLVVDHAELPAEN